MPGAMVVTAATAKAPDFQRVHSSEVHHKADLRNLNKINLGRENIESIAIVGFALFFFFFFLLVAEPLGASSTLHGKALCALKINRTAK
jgi:hypothetical protein